MSEQVEIEVRCCCNPRKLLGFVQLSENAVQVGADIAARGRDGSYRRVEIARMTRPAGGTLSPRIVFGYLAMKSDHLTADQLVDFLPQFRKADPYEVRRDELWPAGFDDYRPFGCIERKWELAHQPESACGVK